MNEQARYYVMNTEQYGRAVFAQRALLIGEVVMYCEVLPLSEKDTPVVNSTDLQWYTFTFNDKQDCLVLGDGEIFNHGPTNNSNVVEAYDANTSYDLIHLNSRPMMVFRMTANVKKDQQLFIDYNADVTNKKESVLDSYKTNLI